MALILDLAAPDATTDAFFRSYTLDGVAVRLRCVWLPRVRRWYIELQSPGGRVLTLPQLAAPGGSLSTDPRDEETPPGRFVWGPGPDPYVRADLGTALVLTYEPATPRPLPDVPALVRAT